MYYCDQLDGIVEVIPPPSDRRARLGARKSGSSRELGNRRLDAGQPDARRYSGQASLACGVQPMKARDGLKACRLVVRVSGLGAARLLWSAAQPSR